MSICSELLDAEVLQTESGFISCFTTDVNPGGHVLTSALHVSSPFDGTLVDELDAEKSLCVRVEPRS